MRRPGKWVLMGLQGAALVALLVWGAHSSARATAPDADPLVTTPPMATEL